MEKKSEKLEPIHTTVGTGSCVIPWWVLFYVIFIHDVDRKTSIYCITKKFDVFDAFTRWKLLVENDTGNKFKCLRIYNGGRCCSKNFDNYFSCNGTHKENIVP